MSLSIADAKVDTFYKLAKSYYNFFIIIFTTNTQNADLQAWRKKENFNRVGKIDIYMLQNIRKEKKMAIRRGRRKHQ